MFRIDIDTNHPDLAPHYDEDVTEAVVDVLRLLADRLEAGDDPAGPLDAPPYARAYITEPRA